MSVLVTAEEKTNKKNDVKARSLLLMTLPNEHQLTFSQYSDAKTILLLSKHNLEAMKPIRKHRRHCCSNNMKILVHQAQSLLTLSLTGSRRLLVGLQFWEDMKKWSIDDLYQLQNVKQDVKKIVGMLIVVIKLSLFYLLQSNPAVTNDVNTANPAYEVSTVSPNINTACPQDLEQIHEDDLEAMDLKWQLSLLSMRAKRYFQRTGKKIFINANDTAGYDKSKVECFNCHKMGHFARECRAPRNKEGQFKYQDNTRKQGNNEDTSSKAMLAIDGVGFDWSDMAEEQVQTNMALMAFLDSELKCELKMLSRKKRHWNLFKIEKFDNASKSLNKLLESQITDKSKKGLGYNVVPPPHPLIYNRPKKLDLSYSGLDEFKDPEFKSYGSEDKQVSEDTSSFVESSLNVEKETIFLDKKIEFVKPKNHEKPVKKSVRIHSNAQRNMVLRAVLMKTGLKPSNTAMTINTAHPKSIVFSAEPMSHFSKSAQSTARRPYQSKTVLTNKKFTQTNNTAKAKAVNTVRPKAVNTARPHSAVVNIVRINQANAFGCSRHMTRNIAYLSDFKEFDGGYVTFGGGAHNGRISVSHRLCPMYEVNTLKIPRKDNMYSFDMKNIVPKESLTCLVVKATSDESMLWRRRLVVAGTISNESTSTQGEINADASYFEFNSKDVGNGEPKSAADDQKQDEDGPHNETDEKDKSEDDSSPKEVNATRQHVNTASPEVWKLVDLPNGKRAIGTNGSSEIRKMKEGLSMIGSLMYLTAFKPDIIYLKGKPTLGLWYSRDSPFELVAYTDSNYARATQDRKAYNGGYLLTKGFDAGRLVMEALFVIRCLGDRMERAATTASSLEAEQDSGSGPRVHTLGSGEDSMKLMELMAHYTKLSELFWQIASTSTLEDGEVEINATIDGQLKIITEASLRRYLKLEDADGISSLPNSKIFEQLALMGPKKTAWEQFSSNIATAIIYLATNRTFNFSKMIFEGMGRRITEIDQNPSISLVQDERTSWIQEDAGIQGRTSVDTEILLDQEELIELVGDLGSGEKGEKEISTANILVSTVSATPEVSTTVENLVYIRRSAKKRKDCNNKLMKKKDKGLLGMLECAKQVTRNEFDRARQEQEAVAEADQAHDIDEIFHN
ncbi:ribonuclease H-like domain-containing protein [Tanacetum coccineum]